MTGFQKDGCVSDLGDVSEFTLGSAKIGSVVSHVSFVSLVFNKLALFVRYVPPMYDLSSTLERMVAGFQSLLSC